MDWGMWTTGLVGLILVTGLVIKIWGAMLPERFLISETVVLNRFNHEIKALLFNPEAIQSWFPIRKWAKTDLSGITADGENHIIQAFYGPHQLTFQASHSVSDAPLSLELRTTLAVGTYPVGFSLQINTRKAPNGLSVTLEEELVVKEVNIRFGFHRILLPELKAGFNHMTSTWKQL